MNPVKKLQQRREVVEKKIRQGIAKHGYDFYDMDEYLELLEEKRTITDEIMKPEPSVVSEKTFKSRW